jgi:hypothetical protein
MERLRLVKPIEIKSAGRWKTDSFAWARRRSRRLAGRGGGPADRSGAHSRPRRAGTQARFYSTDRKPATVKLFQELLAEA